jgi:hypothetical protein
MNRRTIDGRIIFYTTRVCLSRLVASRRVTRRVYKKKPIARDLKLVAFVLSVRTNRIHIPISYYSDDVLCCCDFSFDTQVLTIGLPTTGRYFF